MAYSIRADIEAIFGVDNVTKWGDLNNNENAGEITARITAAIVRADDDIDNALRGGQYKTLPFTSVPETIKQLSATLSGVHLYEARGVTDFNVESGQPQHQLHWQRKRVETDLKKIRSGQIRLDVDPDYEYTPKVIEDTYDRSNP